MNLRKLKRIKKNLVKLAKLEIHQAIRLLAAFLHLQVKIRPRLRLIAKILPILIITFALTSEAIAYLKPKEAEVKINGQAILVAQNKDEDSNPEPDLELNQSVVGRRSPFDFQRPVENGYLSQSYSSYHQAYDIATDLGTPIHPLGAGFVDFAGRVTDGKGNIVVIDHGDGLKSLYAHMGKIEVGVGDLVNSNTAIGTVGLTGRTTGPHVHLEIYDNGRQIDPVSVLPE
ncbi:hypothetical protein A2693_01080 [Candidatus Curtissbacteria bacterium RIFCSPHIGHO2_01_FULL_40_12]|uniref:M23ase beta-sheet core domain-containing protein n=1 Tax=Candidatus Curtissbacteria bacterium RIFCSPHIGHO2_01_FULL_40_12 TaxID=1797710 RepID=A0A1F5GCL9_9BACT|nr:MAG: hypothetical protein A2693_01080 [Candidatus Curtissbacteria bacterium RIFCSPHIGHO2_01_FULL_40_12]